jgi:hypothetical protein
MMKKPMLISHMPKQLKQRFVALNKKTGVNLERLYGVAMWHGLDRIEKDPILLNNNPLIKLPNGNQ